MILAAAVVLTLGALSFILFVRMKDVPDPLPVSPVQHLEDRKQAIYDNLRDLQFEYRLGKLSDEDYRQTKQALQKELAGVLAEMEATSKRLGLTPARNIFRSSSAGQSAAVLDSTICPHCGAKFPQPMKFCGECGRTMAS